MPLLINDFLLFIWDIHNEYLLKYSIIPNMNSEFVLINVAGKSKVIVKDGKGDEKIFELDHPHSGIYIPTMVWKDMYDFSEDSVLLVLASTHYDANEYIRNYDDFIKMVTDKFD